jgi:hypothetical protein
LELLTKEEYEKPGGYCDQKRQEYQQQKAQQQKQNKEQGDKK